MQAKTIGQCVGFVHHLFSKKKGFSKYFNETMTVHDSSQPFTINSVIQIQYPSVIKMLLKQKPNLDF